jgi:hypothetical protein
MKRILFAAIIGLIFTSCQKQIDATSSSSTASSNNNNNTNFGVSSVVTPETLNKGLLAYYTFSGNALDASGNANDGVVHGAKLVADRFGNPSSAYSFGDATNNTINNNISISNLHTSLVTYSVSGWFLKASNSINTSGTIYAGDQPVNGPGDLKFAIATTNSAELNAKYKTNISVGITTQNVPDQSANYSDGIWHSFVITFNANTTTLSPNNFQIYIDGVLVPTQNLYKSELTPDSAPVTNADLPIILGNSQGQNNAFPGTLDNIRIFNRVLNQAEVTYLANEK